MPRLPLLTALLTFAAPLLIFGETVFNYDCQPSAARSPDGGWLIPLAADGTALPRQGTLSVRFEFRPADTSATSTLDLPWRRSDRAQTRGLSWLETPLFQTQLFVGPGAAGMNFNFAHSDGKTRLARQPWSRLDAAKPYVLSLTWDLDAATIATTINGVSQGDLRHWGTDYAGLAPRPGSATLKLGGTLRDGPDSASFLITAARLDDRVLSEAELAALATAWNAAPLSGEVRTVHGDRTLDLSGLTLEPLYTADFSQPVTILTEDSLFDGDARTRRPPADAWVLEGDGRAWIENNLLHLATNHEPNDQAHLVLWLNRTFPGNIIVDYTFTPETTARGLHILFWSAHRSAGGDIFTPGLPRRHGDFKPYIVGELGSYHASVFATDEQNLRRTANLRKNPGFALVSVGEDRIGGADTPGPFRVRLLKVGPRMTLAVGDHVVLDYTDSGRAHGPVWQDGQLGFRFMSHTRSATLGSLTVHRVVSTSHP